MKKSLILLLIIISSCSNKSSLDLNKLDGYWEIYQVEKQGNIIKEYSISTTIDYFKFNDDSTGFRKKVAPQLDGSFIVSKVASTFKINSINNKLHIIYTDKKYNSDEEIIKLSEKKLNILNSEGFIYKYKRFEKFDLINE